MTALPIVQYPKEILARRAKHIDNIEEDLRELIPHMVETMLGNDGIGLAAPQIDISKRIIVVSDFGKEKNRNSPQQHLAFINPKIVWRSKQKEVQEEGCLSIPGIFVPVKRSLEVEVEAMTPEGEPVNVRAHGLAAKIFQHEVDHLNGTLIIDRINIYQKLKLKNSLKEFRAKSLP